MDRLTDVLTNFFVSHKTNTYTETKDDLQTTQTGMYTKQSILLQQSSSESSESNESSESIESIESIESSESSESSESIESSESSESSESNSTILSRTIVNKKENILDEGKLSSVLKKDNLVKDIVELKEDDNGSLNTELKKYILKPLEFYKKNIMIVNENKRDNVDILSNLLYKLNLIKDINKIYDDNIHIITQNDNKKSYKKILLDNPYLYFTNFDFKEEISKKFLQDLDNLEKRTIYIIDTNISCENDNIIKLLSANKNIHVILILNMKNDNFIDMYELIGDNKLLIHKINKLKSMQKQFYKLLLNPICTNNFENFDSYYDALNNEDLDVKYIIFKNKELRYN